LKSFKTISLGIKQLYKKSNDYLELFLYILLFLIPVLFLEIENFFTFFKIVLTKSLITFIISLFAALLIMLISVFFAIINIYFRKIDFTLFVLIISVWPVVYVVNFLQLHYTYCGHCLEIISLICSGFLIYYFTDHLCLDLKNEIKNSYIETYMVRNHNIIFTLKEKIILNCFRQYPICFLQVVTYTLFTDILIFKETNGVGIISWAFIIEKEGLYGGKAYLIYLMIIMFFLFIFRLYNLTILRLIENRLIGKR